MRTELYYFPKKELLCTSSDELNFHVINGAYSFELHSTTAVLPSRSFEVGEYEEHTRKSFNGCYPKFGY